MRLQPSQLWREWQRLWFRLGGEQKVLTTFWPGDYRRGDACELEGRQYRITRYVRAVQPDGRFFEVWGRLAEAVEPASEAYTAQQASTPLQRLTPRQQ